MLMCQRARARVCVKCTNSFGTNHIVQESIAKAIAKHMQNTNKYHTNTNEAKAEVQEEEEDNKPISHFP